MEQKSHWLVCTHISGFERTPSDTSSAESKRSWRCAQERVLLYLRGLGLPPREALAIALEALDRAGRETESSLGSHPAAASMRALRRLLSERYTLTREGTLGFWSPYLEFPRPTCQASGSGVMVAPPLNRGHMSPESNRRHRRRSLFHWPFRRPRSRFQVVHS